MTLSAKRVLLVNLVDKLAFEKVVPQRNTVTQALQGTVHVARIGQVLKTREAILLPILDCFVRGLLGTPVLVLSYLA